MGLIKFLGALLIMGFLIDLFTLRKKNKKELQKIKSRLSDYSEKVGLLSEQSNLQSMRVEQETNKLLYEVDKLRTSTDSAIKCCNSLVESIEGVTAKINILADTFENPDMSDSNKIENARKYVELIRRDIENNQEFHKSCILNQDWGLGYGR